MSWCYNEDKFNASVASLVYQSGCSCGGWARQSPDIDQSRCLLLIHPQCSAAWLISQYSKRSVSALLFLTDRHSDIYLLTTIYHAADATNAASIDRLSALQPLLQGGVTNTAVTQSHSLASVWRRTLAVCMWMFLVTHTSTNWSNALKATSRSIWADVCLSHLGPRSMADKKASDQLWPV